MAGIWITNEKFLSLKKKSHKLIRQLVITDNNYCSIPDTLEKSK